MIGHLASLDKLSEPEKIRQRDPHAVVFTPPQSLAAFWHSNHFYQFIVGPLGSTKTTNCIFKMLSYAQQQPKQVDGKRRSRWVIARPTLQQIKTTVLKDIEQWLSPIAKLRVSDSLVQIRTDEVVSDWHMIPLETIEDQRRLLSMQLTGVYFNEFREIPFELVSAAAGRVGRYPSKEFGGCTWHGVIGDSNPPSEDSQYYKFLVLDKPDNVHYTHQPGGLSPEADWRKYLPTNYYENLIIGHNEEWVNVHVNSQWGESLAGQPVYKHSFSKKFHVAKESLKPQPGQPLVIGMDFARWPAAVICQLDNTGRFFVFKELERENCGVEAFVREDLIPALADERFQGFAGYVVGDPSGVVRSQIGEESVFTMLNNRLGIPSYPAMTNNVDPRIRAVEKFLLQQRGGEAALIIDPFHCPLLIRGFVSEYKFKQKKDGTLQDAPDKSNRPYPDIHDALQYACLGTSKSIRSRIFNKTSTPARSHNIPTGAWT